MKEIALAVIHLTAAKLDLRPLTGGLQYRSELTWFDVLDKDSDDETIKSRLF